MRIWYQSSAPLDKSPLWKQYGESLKRHVQKVARAGTVVDVHGLDLSCLVQDRSHSVEYTRTAQWIDNARVAEREGYDAFAGGCMLDPGFNQIREAVDIPVAFGAETSLHLACILAHKFSIVAYNEALLLQIEERVKQYGVWERFVHASCCSMSEEELLKDPANAADIVKAVRKGVKKAIKDGAGILVPSCNVLNMVLVSSAVSEIDGVPVLDNVGVVVKMAELLVDLKQIGVTRSKSDVMLTSSETKEAKWEKRQ